MKVGATAGIIGGVLAGVVVLGIVIYCCCCKKDKKEKYVEGYVWITFKGATRYDILFD